MSLFHALVRAHCHAHRSRDHVDGDAADLVELLAGVTLDREAARLLLSERAAAMQAAPP